MKNKKKRGKIRDEFLMEKRIGGKEEISEPRITLKRVKSQKNWGRKTRKIKSREEEGKNVESIT